MRRAVAAVVVWLIGVATVPGAGAGTILIPKDPATTAHVQINAFDPIGMAFTAIDPFVTAALYFDEIGASTPDSPSTPLRYDLWQGIDTSGSLLASSAPFVLPTTFSGFYDVDFSSVMLNVGQPYSLTVSVVGSSRYWAVGLAAFNAYPSNVGILSGSSAPQQGDFALRVVGNSVAPVPEPSTLLLFGTGLLGAGVMRRRRRKQ